MRCNPLFYRLLSLLAASGIIVLDQWSKIYVLTLHEAGQLPVAVTSFFNIVFTFNRGISFGMLRNMQEWMPLALTLGTSAVALAMFIWLLRTQERHTMLALGCVIGGAIGNIIDRVRYGAVVDFLDFHASGLHWPAFNVADSAIFVGVVILIFGSIVWPSKTDMAKPVENNNHAPN